MAKSQQTFNKLEREKNKAKKREEKRKKMQARKEADEAIRQELKDLGVQPTSFGQPFHYHWKF